MNRKKLFLAVLFLVFLGAVVSAVVRSPHQEQVKDLKYRTGSVGPVRRSTVAAPKAAAGREEGGLDVALLEREQPVYSGYRRNIFTPIFREEVKLPPVKSIPLPPKPSLPPPPPPRPPVQPLPPSPPVDHEAAELTHFTFLGFLSKDGAKTVFLAKDKEILLVKKGATVAGKYKVTSLTDDALTLASITTGKELVIPLVENRALTPQRAGRRTP